MEAFAYLGPLVVPNFAFSLSLSFSFSASLDSDTVSSFFSALACWVASRKKDLVQQKERERDLSEWRTSFFLH